MWLGAEVEDLCIVRMIDVCEDAEELAVDMLDYGREVRGEVVAYKDQTSVRSFTRETIQDSIPDFVGKAFSSSKRFCTQVMT